ncbi:MAG: hypothetical protein M5U13_12155 [Thermoanaerobaculia bacterium]|nr:hypothetical protein [Thermoanaerobaculia bacterium]
MKRRAARLCFVVLLGAGSITCGPGGGRSLEAERIPVTDEPGWRLSELSLSPNGQWAAVSAASSSERLGFRLFLIDLGTLTASEATPSRDAEAQLVANREPGMVTAVWAANGSELRFAAGRVEPSWILGAYQSETPTYQRSVTVGSRAWFRVAGTAAGHWALELDDSPATVERPPVEAHSIDPRLTIRWLGRGSFDLLDQERGGRVITTFRGITWYHLDTATIAPGGDWIALTVGREAAFHHGSRGLLVERATGRRTVLGDLLVGALHFHPTKREIYGVSKEGGPEWELVRWRY